MIMYVYVDRETGSLRVYVRVGLMQAVHVVTNIVQASRLNPLGEVGAVWRLV